MITAGFRHSHAQNPAVIIRGKGQALLDIVSIIGEPGRSVGTALDRTEAQSQVALR